MIRDNLIIFKPTSYGEQVSLNLTEKEDIQKFLVLESELIKHAMDVDTEKVMAKVR